jgi:tRNA pseudouridine32 synthase/23S rRNA pseudouridine746 synthase
MAMNKAAHRHISKQFELRQTRKSYIAEVYGQVEQESGEIDLPLICDWPNRPKQMVDHTRGKSAQTHWQVLNRQKSKTRLELTPITGRSHQLRVHMLSIGHPILGDRLYAHEQALSMSSRLLLHAQTLSFTHPQLQQTMTFECPAAF